MSGSYEATVKPAWAEVASSPSLSVWAGQANVDLHTAIGYADNPATLDLFGPVTATTLRTWMTRYADPDGQTFIGVTHRRTGLLQALIPTDARLFRGTKADALHGLHPGCKQHHQFEKHTNGWQLKKIAPTEYEWTSPYGHTYRYQQQPLTDPDSSRPPTHRNPATAGLPARPPAAPAGFGLDGRPG